MPRPRSILWVDDEVESLSSHILFLEEQGFSVEKAAHGDDALVLLQRQPFGVVLLDEQMPGRRGLELFRAIRSIDTTMPVVMVTKSEEPGTLKDAIGADISDYLVKPVNPRQVLSVVTRLLEGDRIRQQRLSRDFATRFRELEASRHPDMNWREWTELVVELAEWEVRLGQADEPGLSEALRTLQESLRAEFARFIERHYAGWLRGSRAERPPLSVDIVPEFVEPAFRQHGKALLVVVDCLRLDQWEAIRPLISTRFDVETSYYFSIVPTATPFARNAIFSGLFPRDLAARYPGWWKDQDENSLNAHEQSLLAAQLELRYGRVVPVRYEKVFTAADGESLLTRLPAQLAADGVTALVFNFIDQLTHGRTEVFAVTKRHAATLAEMFDHAFAELKPDPATRYADYVVSDLGPDDEADAYTKIRRFKKAKFPQILVSVNMLDTGFDCPEIVNLVFARFTRSSILYQQMRGRGTRKLPGKPIFTLFDFVGVTDLHGDADSWGEGGVVTEARP